MCAPDERYMQKCIKDLREQNVKLLIRTCESTYQIDQFVKAGIDVETFFFQDGEVPNKELINKWMSTCDKFFEKQ